MTAQQILDEKKRQFDEKEVKSKLLKQQRDDEKEQERLMKMELAEKEMEVRRKLKAELDEKNEEKARHIIEKERLLNMRLEARGLLAMPADRLRKGNEEMKQEILKSLESTKAIELKKAQRQVKQEEAAINMKRKSRAEEYKKEKIMNKMAADEQKLKEINDEREAIKVKREIAANTALIERNRVQEMAKKALGGKNMNALLENGTSPEELVSTMLGVGKKESGGGKNSSHSTETTEKKIIVATKEKSGVDNDDDSGSGSIDIRGGKNDINIDSTVNDGNNVSMLSGTGASGFDFTVKTASNRTHLAPVPNPYAEVDEVRKRQNTELLAILTEEQQAEEKREELLKNTQHANDEERQAMKERFARERNEASNRLLRYTKAHEETLAAAVEAANKQRDLLAEEQK